MVLGIALALFMLAMPLQLLGYATTCTQATDNSFVTGAMLSALPLVLSVAIVLSSALRGSQGWQIGIVLIALTAILLTATGSIWVDTIRYGTPCGPDFVGYGWEHPTNNFVILAGYLWLPLFVLVSAMLLVWRRIRK